MWRWLLFLGLAAAGAANFWPLSPADVAALISTFSAGLWLAVALLYDRRDR